MLAPALCDYDVSGRQLSLVNFSLVEAVAWQPVTVPDTRAMLCQKDLMAEVKLVSKRDHEQHKEGGGQHEPGKQEGAAREQGGHRGWCARPSG